MANNENLSNSIWPNGIKTDSEGYAIFYPLGTNKTSVPSTAEEWPAGDKLISPFVYQDDKLVGFCDTKAMTVSGKTSITLNYEHIEADFSSIEEGMLTITAPNATTAKYTWSNSTSSDTGNSGDTVVLGTKYLGCKTINDVKAVDPNYLTNDIVDGAWTQSLADLEESNVTPSSSGPFEPPIDYGYGMFAFYSNLTSFDSDLGSLKGGQGMFLLCMGLESFSVSLPKLTDGSYMFALCENLTSFKSNLPSLTHAPNMFNGCKLDTESVQNIANSINDVNDLPTDQIVIPEYIGIRTITIGIGNTTPNVKEEDSFNLMVSKGWTIYVNGSTYTPSSIVTTMTLDENGEVKETPIPFYAKPVPAHETKAEYVDSEGNYYNILGAQFIYGADLSTYGMFLNEEDAAANMRLIKLSK